MKFRFILLLILSGLLTSVSSVNAQTTRAQFRGMWVNAWGRGLKTPAEIDLLVKRAQSAHLNALLVQVRKRGDAYYFSETEPHAADIASDFDPLAYLLEKCHASGIQVHAWMVMYPAWSDRKKAPPAGHILNLRPDWATVRKDGHRMTTRDGDEGIFLDPGLPGVQDYLLGVMREMVTRYPVDGLHMDYIRYPGKQWGFHPESVRRFRSETGHSPSGAPAKWDQWRRNQVTNLVRCINMMVDSTRPAVRLSAAVFPNRHESYVLRLQEWERWGKQGLVDFIAPMNYATTRSVFASRSAALMRRGGRRPIYMGVGGGNKSESAVLQQMQLLQTTGAAGIILYHYDGNSPQFWEKMSQRLYRRPALVPDLPWKPQLQR